MKPGQTFTAVEDDYASMEELDDWVQHVGIIEDDYEQFTEYFDGQPFFGGNINDHIDIGQQYQQRVVRLRTTGAAFDVQFHGLENVENLDGFMVEAMKNVLGRVADVPGSSKVGICIRHPAIDKPVVMPFRYRRHWSPFTIIELMKKVLQSNEVYRADDAMVWQVTTIDDTEGSGKGPKHATLQDWTDSKSGGHGSSIIKIENNDNTCLARALITAKSRAHRTDNETARKLYDSVVRGDKNRYTKQRELAKQLMNDAKLEKRDGHYGLPELKKMHETDQLKHYRIRVFSKDNMMHCVYDEGEGITLNLLHGGKHFDVLGSVAGMFDDYWCDKCNKSYHNKRRHTKCGERCPCCFEVGVCDRTGPLVCDDCGRWFAGQSCYENHKKESAGTSKRARVDTTCDIYKKCKCGVCYRTDNEHECGKTKCGQCGEMYDSKTQHLCHMQQIEPEKVCKGLVFYDMETTQEEVVDTTDHGDVLKHHVNLVCAKKICDKCRHEPACKTCGQRDHVFKGDDSLEQFCRWLFTDANKGCVAMAHNAKGFDAQFVLQYIHKQCQAPTIIQNGMEIIKLSFMGVTMLDTYSYMPISLAMLPAAMGFKGCKGHFPHLYNTKANWNVVQQGLPDKKFYGFKHMKPKQAAEFSEWYAAHEKDEFDFQAELVKYCEMDVEVLAEGAMRFRDVVIKEQDMDPFANSTTLASMCMAIYRKNFLPDNETIGTVPHRGYRASEQQSVTAIKWLKWLSHSQGVDIQHARNGREVRIGNYKVDGQDRQNPRVVYEFHGDIYHGCPKCIKQRDAKLPKSNKTAHEAYEDTQIKEAELRKSGFTVITKWGCELDAELKASQEMRDFFDGVEIHDPLDPREGFFGGRTNCRKLWHVAEDDEQIRYADICSLYPYVCKWGKFPISHPTIYTEGFKPLDDEPYHGMIKLHITPPKKLLHPVLPHRVGGKLLFHLCRSCAEIRQDVCDHNDAERSWWGVYATCEVYAAIKRGYKVREIAEVYHYEEWSEGETGMFAGYIDAFLQKKQEASGWPRECKTTEERAKYLSDYEAHEGIKLDADKISEEGNPGLRFLSKLCLNSFWGKLGQRSTLSKKLFFTDADEYFATIFDDTNEICDVTIVSPTMVSVSYRKIDEYTEELPNTSVVIAAWVTAQARLHLYSFLEPLAERVLYMDTDSVIYLEKPSDAYHVPLGSFLGSMTDELDGSYIQEFVSLGPKQYAYKTANGKFCVKIRGFTIDSETSKQLNFESMKKMMHAHMKKEDEKIDVVRPQIVRQKNHDIVTKNACKRYAFVYDKCAVTSGYRCLPFGYL